MDGIRSPLRYPGGKAALTPVIEAMVRQRPVHTIVEPFCGGASVSLALLAHGAVQHATIADADDIVAAFWVAATTQPTALVAALRAERPTLDRWDYWRAARPTDTLSKAVKAVYLNRTSFSGNLSTTAGPLGGRAQTGRTRIDARWYIDTVSARISSVGRLAAEGRLEARMCADWRETLSRVDQDDDDWLVYLDPPYVGKGHRLYPMAFGDEDHRDLAKWLQSPSAPSRWALSYDDHPLVRQLYAGCTIQTVHLHHSAAGGRRKSVAHPELLITPSP